MKITALSVLTFLYVYIGYSQTKNYGIGRINLHLSEKIKLISKPDERIELKFASIENGNYFVINKLKYDNKKGKAMAYFKEFDIYVVREENALNYYTFNEAFPRGGFYKDGVSKTIFDQKAERYSFDNDVVNMQLWVVDGEQPHNDLISEFKSIGVLKNIPINKKITAITFYGIEFDINDFVKVTKDKDESDLKDFLVTFHEKDSIVNEFNKKLYNNDTLAIKNYPELTKKSFKYKINFKIKKTDSFGKVKYEFKFTKYRNDDDLESLDFFASDDPINSKVVFSDYNNELEYNLNFKNNRFKIKSVYKLRSNNSDWQYSIKEINSNLPYKTFFYGKKSKFKLHKIITDDTNYPNMINQDSKNGFITKVLFLNDLLEKTVIEETIETGEFNFKLNE